MSSRNPLFHESVWYSLPAAVIASAISSALVMWETDISTDKVLKVAVPNIAIFIGLWLWNSKPWQKPWMIKIRYEKPPLPAKAVVAMVSMGNGSQSAKAAAAFHKDTLEQVWLITTPAARPDAERIAGEIAALRSGIVVNPIVVIRNRHTIETVKDEVDKIRRQALKDPGMGERDVICDFTGLTKHASAGMVLACAQRQARLQYMMPAETDERGRAISPAEPIEVEVAYEIAAEPEEPYLG